MRISSSLILSLSIFAILTNALISPELEDVASRSLFEVWKSQHGREYASTEEENYRYTVFLTNYQYIQSYNAANIRTTLALNQFADLRNDEFASVMTSGVTKDDLKKGHSEKAPKILSTESIPDYVNWVQAGYVTPIKNQEQCGGCWAFAAASSMESFYALTGGPLTSFSAQELIDCVGTCDGCDGCSNLYNALQWTSVYGIESWDSYPFEGQQGSCQYSQAQVISRNSGFENVAENNMDQFLAAIAQQPVNVGIEASQNVFQFYSTGVIGSDCGDEIDHAVTAVGYGSYNGENVYLIKNQWGTTWGQEGYGFISGNPNANGGSGACGILSCPVYPTQI
jgi:C1A family cysteine protease